MGKKKYSTKLKSEEVDIDGSPYVIHEMGGEKLDEWTVFHAGRAQFKNGIPVGMKPPEGFRAKLISLCLKTKDGKPVPEDTIKTWNASTQQGLYEDCERINGLSTEAREEEKKG